MSVEATSWVWNHSRSAGTARLVLLRIADQAGKTGANAWPGIDTLVEDCQVAKADTVRAAIRKLAELGELAVWWNEGGNQHTRGDRRPNRFDLPLVPGYEAPAGLRAPDLGTIPTAPQTGGVRPQDVPEPAAPHIAGVRSPGDPKHDPPSQGPRPPISGVNDPPFQGSTTPHEMGAYPSMIHPDPSKTPEQPPLLTVAPAAPLEPQRPPSFAASFAEFWDAYPVKRGKKAAFAGWARLSRENRRLALERLPAYLASIKPDYIQHGSTYVSQQTWLDFETSSTAPTSPGPAGEVDELEAARRWNEKQAQKRAEADAERRRREVGL